MLDLDAPVFLFFYNVFLQLPPAPIEGPAAF